MLLGLTWVVSQACLRAIYSREGVFLRTPKQQKRRQPSTWESLRIVRAELAIGSVCASTALAVALLLPVDMLSARTLIVVLLLWQAATYFSAVRACRWSDQQDLRGVPPFWHRSFRTLGHAWGRLASERGTAVLVAVGATLLSILFYVAVIGAPMRERLMRADPLTQFLPARSILAVSAPEQAAALLIQEADAVRRVHIADALALWHPEGILRDANFTPDVPEDDRVWAGSEQLLARYQDELANRRYRRLVHDNLQIEFHADEVVITNDLLAEFENGDRQHRIQLPSSDRWVLRRYGGQWRIVSLELNRTLAIPDGGAAPERSAQ
jgi:hypothetical protein